ncbi:hypothetical protein G6F55_013734 [Rhizopus delemar]|nr:hypothetical protein G6F55_013734 [Rhizopus delemar]
MRHEVARAALQQIRRRQAFQLVVEIDSHVGQQLVGHGVRQPGLQPVEQRGQRGGDQQPDDQPGNVPAVPDGGHDQGTEDAHPDEGCHARHPQQDGRGQGAAPRPDDGQQRAQGGAPADLLGVLVQRAQRRSLLVVGGSGGRLLRLRQGGLSGRG